MTNKEYQEITSQNNVQMLPFHNLPCQLLWTHDLHLNKRGKALLANMVLQLINKEANQQPKTPLNSSRYSAPLQITDQTNVPHNEERKFIFSFILFLFLLF